MTIHDNTSEQQGYLFAAFALLVCGAIALPMLPIWQGGLRILAGIFLVQALGTSDIKRRLLTALLGTLIGITAIYWLTSLASHPVNHVIHALTDVFGQPLGLLPDGALLGYDAICITGLTAAIIQAQWHKNRQIALFSAIAGLFWLWSLLTPVSFILNNGDINALPQMATGLSGWATWVYWVLLTLLLVKSESHFRAILNAAGIGGLLVGSVTGLQWVLSDYSYVIAVPGGISDYFYRVRGTDYYHASATFAIVMATFPLLALYRKNSIQAWPLFGALFLVAMSVLNNTRALSLALIVGLAVTLISMVRQKQWWLAVLMLISMTVVSSQVLYLKPTGNQTSAQVSHDSGTTPGAAALKPEAQAQAAKPSEPEIQAAKPSEPSVSDVVSANAPRATLADIGMKTLPSALLTGHGIGTLELLLEGNVFNGMSSTYSTHSLYMDIALMAGAPALILMLCLFGMAAWRAFSHGLLYMHRGASGILASLLVFSVASLFLPQERNELIGIAFLFAALAMTRPVINDKIPKSGRWGYALIGLMVVLWSVMTSPSYVFPAIELAARYGGEISQEKQDVLVTEPAIRPLLAFLLRLRGVDPAHVKVLQDDPRYLPEENAWLIWTPTMDSSYPNLRKFLGYRKLNYGNQAIALTLPSHWWVMPSAQPVVAYLFAGKRAEIPFPLQQLVQVTPYAGVTTVINTAAGQGIRYLATETKSAWKLGIPAAQTDSILLDINTITPGDKAQKLLSSQPLDSLAIQKSAMLYADDVAPGTNLELLARTPTWPNLTPHFNVHASATIANPSAATDLNYGSNASWRSNAEAEFEFELSSQHIHPLRIYRLVALGLRSMQRTIYYSWVLEGSRDKQTWKELDRRSQQPLSQDATNPSAYFLTGHEGFPYYRLRFLPSTVEPNKDSGVSEIEFYVAPLSQANTERAIYEYEK